MLISAPPLGRCENHSFTIIHNGNKYNVDPMKFAETSMFFATKLLSLDNRQFVLNDLHSERAFQSFIRMCNYEEIQFNFDDLIELQSIFDEWNCPKLKEYVNKVVVDTPHLHSKEEPFVEIPADQTKEEFQLKPVQTEGVNPFGTKPATETAIKLPPTPPAKEKSPKKETKQEAPKQTGPVKLHIKTRTGNLYSIAIARESTVENLKKVIAQRTGIPVKSQILYFNMKMLENQTVIGATGVKDKSRIYLERSDDEPKGDEITVVVQHQTCSDIPYYISASRKIEDLLMFIRFKEARAPPLNIMFDRKMLDPQQTIKEAGIQDYSKVMLVCSN